MLEKLTVADFAEHLNQAFRLHPGSSGVDLVLVEAENRGAPRGGFRAPFALVFRGPDDRRLPQGTYRLEHPDLGVLDLFLVPIGRDPDGRRYEAVFG